MGQWERGRPEESRIWLKFTFCLIGNQSFAPHWDDLIKNKGIFKKGIVYYVPDTVLSFKLFVDIISFHPPTALYSRYY